MDKQFCEYFDPFGLITPYEIKNYLKTSGKKIVYSSDEIQERDSVLCGYWYLYYLLERQNGRSLLAELYKKDTVFCAVIGTYIIFWRDKMVDHY